MEHTLRAGADLKLSTIDPDSTPGWGKGQAAAEKALASGSDELATLQEQLFANSRFGGVRSVLVVLQAMDTAGKGGIVRHSFGGADPAGLRSYAFKAPTEEEKQHDFLWRVRRQLPPPGYLAIFDRSHYEDVLVHRVRGLSSPAVVEGRYGLINDFEADVVASGTAVIKVMLHISADEQKERLLDRLDRRDKQWKFNPGDLDEREYWSAYQEAYEIAIRRTATSDAPWYVVPANRKWYARLAVQEIVLHTLRQFDLGWPSPEYDVEQQKRRLAGG